MMQPRGRSPVPFAADEWVEILVGRRKFFGTPAVDNQDAAPPPSLTVSSYQQRRRGHRFPYLVNWAEIYVVVNRIFLVLAAMDGDSIEELTV